MITRYESQAGNNLLSWPREHKRQRALWVFRVTLLPNDMAVCFNHADSFEIDHFDQNFHLIFWLKVNDDTVFEASILEYDRYEPRLGARSCYRYLGFWQDVKISIYYVNQVLLVILNFKKLEPPQFPLHAS